MAAEARPFSAVIDPDAFLAPGDMPRRSPRTAARTGQRRPPTPGEFARAILESLALRYRQVLESLEELLRAPHRGDPHRRRRLAQHACSTSSWPTATGRTVVAGPVEATAIGNVLVQAMGAGDIGEPGRRPRARPPLLPRRNHRPRPAAGWDRAYEKFCSITAR